MSVSSTTPKPLTVFSSVQFNCPVVSDSLRPHESQHARPPCPSPTPRVCVDHDKLWKALKEEAIPDHLTCLLRNLYAGQEATVRTLYGTTDWFQIEKGVWQGCLLSPCLFNLDTEHIMKNAGLHELQARIEIGRRNNNLRYVDDTTLMAESEEELKSLLIRVNKECERAGSQLNIKKN